MRTLLQLALTLLLVLAAAPAGAQTCNDPDADPGRCKLWDLVDNKCVPEQQSHQILLLPCMEVELTAGYVIIKDRTGDSQFLAIPTAPVAGIEDKKILGPGAPNYFADAWQWRDLVSEALFATDPAFKRAGKKLPRDDVGLAINSKAGRTQDQLHIHIDCLLPEVVDAVRDNAATVTDKWAPFPVNLAGDAYLARSVASADLSGINVFDLLADRVNEEKTKMIEWTLGAVPTTVAGAPGFLLLANHVTRASAEKLQDHDCAIKSSN